MPLALACAAAPDLSHLPSVLRATLQALRLGARPTCRPLTPPGPALRRGKAAPRPMLYEARWQLTTGNSVGATLTEIRRCGVFP
eukprot:5554435-Alexandrium_andersonii.AAC.1